MMALPSLERVFGSRNIVVHSELQVSEIDFGIQFPFKQVEDDLLASTERQPLQGRWVNAAEPE